jgi:hypothetical protein
MTVGGGSSRSKESQSLNKLEAPTAVSGIARAPLKTQPVYCQLMTVPALK